MEPHGQAHDTFMYSADSFRVCQFGDISPKFSFAKVRLRSLSFVEISPKLEKQRRTSEKSRRSFNEGGHNYRISLHESSVNQVRDLAKLLNNLADIHR